MSSGISLIAGSNQEVFGFIVVSALVGVLYWFVLGRTRFGFDLRASGLNPFAAVASGVDAKRMIVYTMVASGAVTAAAAPSAGGLLAAILAGAILPDVPIVILYLRERLNEILAKHSKQPIDVIRRDTERDFFMGAQDAVKYGIVDKVLVSRENV